MDKLYEEREKYEIVKEEDGGNLTTRVNTEKEPDGTEKLLILTECKLVPFGLKPNDFSFYPDMWQDLIQEINPRILSIKELGEVEGIKVCRTEASCPFPLSNRVVFQWRTGQLDMENQNHYFIMSSKGSESLSNWSKEDESNFARATIHVGGYKFIPVKNESGEVIGTSLFNVQSSDPGGNIPSTITNSVAPDESL